MEGKSGARGGRSFDLERRAFLNFPTGIPIINLARLLLNRVRFNFLFKMFAFYLKAGEFSR